MHPELNTMDSYVLVTHGTHNCYKCNRLTSLGKRDVDHNVALDRRFCQSRTKLCHHCLHPPKFVNEAQFKECRMETHGVRSFAFLLH